MLWLLLVRMPGDVQNFKRKLRVKSHLVAFCCRLKYKLNDHTCEFHWYADRESYRLMARYEICNSMIDTRVKALNRATQSICITGDSSESL